MNKLNICVTGATGFLGSRLVEKLDQEDVNIFVIGRNLKRLEYKRLSNVYYIEYDLNNPKTEKTIEKIDSIDCLIHLAAYVPKHGSEDDIRQSIETNVLGTMHLIDSIGKITKKIIFGSTLEVYGLPVQLPISEKHPTEPLTFYGASKLSAEKYLNIYSTKTGAKVIILRFTSIYGPGEIYERALPNFIRSVIKNENLLIFGEGQDVRDYLYVDDAVKAIFLAIEKDCEGVFNIASGKTYTKKEVAEEIIRLSEKDLKLVFTHPEHKSTNFTFDISKAKKVLSFSPDTDLEEGLLKEIEWYRNKRGESK